MSNDISNVSGKVVAITGASSGIGIGIGIGEATAVLLAGRGAKVVPNQAVYAGTKNAFRTIIERLWQEAGPKLRVTGVSPGYVGTDSAKSTTDAKAQVGDIVVRPTAQG